MARRTLKHGSVTFESGNSAVEVELGPGAGTFKVSDLGYGPVDGDGYTIPCERISAKNRGAHQEWVDGDDLELPWSIEIAQDGTLHHASDEKVMDAIQKLGAFVAATSADDGSWSGNIVYTSTRGVLVTTIRLRNCTAKTDFAEAKESNSLSLSGICVGGYKISEA